MLINATINNTDRPSAAFNGLNALSLAHKTLYTWYLTERYAVTIL